jgi:hypothetical protein
VLTEATTGRGDVAMGYVRKRDGGDADKRNLGGVVVNPRKSEPLAYAAGDWIIVLAQG